MSLPQATKEVSAKPGKSSVVDPVDKKLKDADVDRKIRFYSVLQAFGNNKYPSNAQIDETLDYVLKHSPVKQDALSDDGKKLIEDVRAIIRAAQDIVHHKNQDELIQAWLYSTRNDISVDEHANAIKANATGAKDQVPSEEKRQQDSKQALQHIRTLINLILTNSEVRKLLTDSGVVGRDLLARGASKATAKLAPTQEQIAAVDETAPRDNFVQDERTDDLLKGRIPGFGKKPKDVKQDLRAEYEPAVREEAADVQREIDDLQNNQTLTESEKEAKKKSLKERLTVAKLTPEQREKLDANKERARTFLMDEYFPKERRDQWIYRLKKVIIECQRHDDYQESLRWLMGAVEEYGTHGRMVAQSSDHSTITSDPALRTSLTQLRTLLERFADGKSSEGIFRAFDVLAQDAKNDEALRNWFSEVDAYIRKVLLDAGYVIEPQCNKRATELRESGKQFYDVKYRAQFDNLFTAIQDFFGGMAEDPYNVKFGEAWARLTKDILFDDEGGLKFKKHLWNDIRSTILPQLVDKIGYVPIPRIEYIDDAVELVVENLVLSGRNLFPNIVTLEAHNFVKFSPYTAIKDEHKHEITLSLGQIQADMRDVAFYFSKKSGFPKIKDSGLADVVLGGEGITATVHLVSSPSNDETSVFQIKNVHVKLDSLKFSIRDSKHDFLYKVVKPLATNLVKKQIQKAIADALTTGLQYVDGQLVGVRQRMDEAQARAKAELAANDSSSKMSESSRLKILREAFKRPQSPENANSVAATTDGAGGISLKDNKRNSSQFKVVSDKRKSLLVDQGHPSGWVNRTTERAELAHQGEGWKSPVFDVVGGGAKGTSGSTGITGTPGTTGTTTAGAGHPPITQPNAAANGATPGFTSNGASPAAAGKLPASSAA